MKKYSEGESEGSEKKMQWNEDGQIEGWNEKAREEERDADCVSASNGMTSSPLTLPPSSFSSSVTAPFLSPPKSLPAQKLRSPLCCECLSSLTLCSSLFDNRHCYPHLPLPIFLSLPAVPLLRLMNDLAGGGSCGCGEPVRLGEMGSEPSSESWVYPGVSFRLEVLSNPPTEEA
ncbi:unnamed protein product [Pleuronectes platessa]|uniref:Uncharacterized protein n=1 Tax=Pleuronectes platessa TaxID=8262 RepID=A0A9N7YRV9_PLEPL|nr:unnamed protein product [Pleuronectes platessa]